MLRFHALDTPPIHDYLTAAGFINACVDHVGFGFHPDTPFKNYIWLSDGSPMFSAEDAERYDAALELAFRFVDVHAVAYERIKAKLAMGEI